MNDQQKIRLAMLAFAGLLLAGGVYAWMAYNNEKQQEAADVADNTAPHVHIAAKKPDAQPAKSDTTGDTGTAGGGKPSADEGTTAAAVKPGAAAPAKPDALAVRPEPKPAVAAPAVKSELDKMPPVVKPVANIRPPVVAAKPVPAVAVKPAAVPPAAPATPNPNSGMATSFKPMPNAAVPKNSLNVRAAAKPVIAALPPAAVPAAVPAAAPAAAAPAAAAPAAPAGPGVAATTEADASTTAKKEAGRVDPMRLLSGFFPFPRNKGVHGDALGPGDVPPPPPGAGDDTAGGDANNGGVGVKGLIGSKVDKLVPPPPPGGDGGGPGEIPIDILPPPPSRPMISDKLQVVSILDDHAIITFPRDLRAKNKWPTFITLGVGEQFDSLKVVAITPDGVTVEEDGERSLKPLPNIK